MAAGEWIALVSLAVTIASAVFYFGRVSSKVDNLSRDVSTIAECRKKEHDQLWAESGKLWDAHHADNRKLVEHDGRIMRLEGRG